MAGRFSTGILAAYCVLVPVSLAAEPAPSAEDPLQPRVDQGAGEFEDAFSRAGPVTRELEQLHRRIDELETAQTARDDASRWIIRDALSTLGSKINEAVTLGGTFEALAGGVEVFKGQSEKVLRLNTAELDLEIQVNSWFLASMILAYDDGTATGLVTGDGSEAFVDRVNIDTAFLSIGNTQRFPIFGTVGQIIAPFGISTGDPVADVLTLTDPLTIDVFETKEDALLIGFAFPTPPLTPMSPGARPPRVRPLVVRPLISGFARLLGYRPLPTRPPPPALVVPPPTPPPFSGGVYIYNGNTRESFRIRSTDSWLTDNFGATLGYRTQGNCGKSYDELRSGERENWFEFFCPWALDVDVDYNNSVFDSLFLESEYQRFLFQEDPRGGIGFVPGMAAHVKSNLGPVALVFEWNGAVEHATFTDDLGTPISIRPMAWQVSLNYQFDWNPWITGIGLQGNYIALGYSESADLAGVTALVGGVQTRVGFVPRRQLLVSAGEWVLDGFRVSVEYARYWDYSKEKGGTGRTANGFFTMFTYVW